LHEIRGDAPRNSFNSTSTASFSVELNKKDDHDVSVSMTEAEVRVRFNMTETEYYEPQHPLDSSIWYSAEETIKFRKECSKVARVLKATEGNSDDATPWSHVLLQAYLGFCEAKTPEEVMKVFETTKADPIDVAIGLDSWIIRPIHYDRVERRRSLLSQILAFQMTSSTNGSSCTNKIFKASRSHSRPSRLYAHHTALLIAETVEEDEA
jgi:hypothetical protein